MLATPLYNCDYDRVYEPAEDSFLLLDSLESELSFLRSIFEKDNYFPIILEIGCGSGIVTTFLHQHAIPTNKGLYLPVDINPWAIDATLQTIKKNPPTKDLQTTTIVDPLLMDLVAGLKSNSVDLLVFNPPYVPAEAVPNLPPGTNDEGWLDLALLGGEDGLVVTNKLLNNLHNILSPKGVAYILFCARNKPQEIQLRMEGHGWKVDLIEKRKAGWEVLSVYKFQKIKTNF
ncbi:related to eRF1 methyltransferase catalytic subunit MTQ2 [Saccharomycodes ludwigii]|uniref:Related to eRF1 methyltransferase catalytic subunit MTQ2 n=1 Tax=Saccharomycodes ludwigii TaxID=36035 RepID=A0A376BAZ8_9ASCO|nr:hypothetical protein SCDLUD_001746 [Saccharomycodes ludwigii]KAH3901960.1 hypothetical protein SCDLUD_001746 [Saccharomycodes ludwigii]SSD61330.1 related to eRF1 methyltransferase catalytic subunit MTQ2 [Saccharomycodes ludwigii]